LAAHPHRIDCLSSSGSTKTPNHNDDKKGVPVQTTLSKLAALLCLALALICGPALAQEAAEAQGQHGTTTILSFDTMIGNPGSSDPANVIRGLNGAGGAWSILRSVHGVLRSNGQLIVIVSGLVVTEGAENPVPQLRAALSCQDPTDPTQGQLFFTGLVPATTGKEAGNASIIGRVQLPATCFAPLILITSPPSATAPDGVWFAVTGF
jgi:hypothetical protein